jgi:hypothetical protein
LCPVNRSCIFLAGWSKVVEILINFLIWPIKKIIREHAQNTYAIFRDFWHLPLPLCNAKPYKSLYFFKASVTNCWPLPLNAYVFCERSLKSWEKKNVERRMAPLANLEDSNLSICLNRTFLHIENLQFCHI